MAKNVDKPNKTANEGMKFIERGIMPAVILTIIAIVSVALLALTEYTTADARAEQQQLMEDVNKRIIFTDADSFPAEDLDEAGVSLPGGHAVDLSDVSTIEAVYMAEKEDEVVGILIAANPLGYGGGRIGLMLGYDLEGNLFNLTVGAQSQTAGLGTKVAEEDFTGQLIGINASGTVSTSGDSDFEVDGISGATTSAEAVLRGINIANEAVSQMLGLE